MEGRAIAIQLLAGDALDEHQVHERAWLVVIDGQAEVVDLDGETGVSALACSPSSTRTSAARSARPRTPACC